MLYVCLTISFNELWSIIAFALSRNYPYAIHDTIIAQRSAHILFRYIYIPTSQVSAYPEMQLRCDCWASNSQKSWLLCFVLVVLQDGGFIPFSSRVRRICLFSLSEPCKTAGAAHMHIRARAHTRGKEYQCFQVVMDQNTLSVRLQLSVFGRN